MVELSDDWMDDLDIVCVIDAATGNMHAVADLSSAAEATNLNQVQYGRVLPEHVAFSPNGEILLIPWHNYTIGGWDLEFVSTDTWQRIGYISNEALRNALPCHANSRESLLALPFYDSVRLYDSSCTELAALRPVVVLKADSQHLAWNSDGTQLAHWQATPEAQVLGIFTGPEWRQTHTMHSSHSTPDPYHWWRTGGTNHPLLSFNQNSIVVSTAYRVGSCPEHKQTELVMQTFCLPDLRRTTHVACTQAAAMSPDGWWASVMPTPLSLHVYQLKTGNLVYSLDLQTLLNLPGDVEIRGADGNPKCGSRLWWAVDGSWLSVRICMRDPMTTTRIEKVLVVQFGQGRVLGCCIAQF